MRSGKLAHRAGVSTDALRHYERLGLLKKPPRTSQGYRDYSPDALSRVQLIRRALGLGFSLSELKTILNMRDRGQVPCHHARAMAENRLQHLTEQIKDLLVMRKHLERLLTDWDGRLAHTRKGERARLLESLPEEWEQLSPAARLSRKQRKENRL